MSDAQGIYDISGTVAAGGTAQDISASNTGRFYVFIQNIDSAEDMWVNFAADATADTPGSILLVANGGSVVYEGNSCPKGRVSVVAATTGHKYTAKEG